MVAVQIGGGAVHHKDAHNLITPSGSRCGQWENSTSEMILQAQFGGGAAFGLGRCCSVSCRLIAGRNFSSGWKRNEAGANSVKPPEGLQMKFQDSKD